MVVEYRKGYIEGNGYSVRTYSTVKQESLGIVLTKKTFKTEVENLRKKGVILSDWKKKILEVECQLGILDKEQLLFSVGINDESKLQRIHRDLIMKLL